MLTALVSPNISILFPCATSLWQSNAWTILGVIQRIGGHGSIPPKNNKKSAFSLQSLTTYLCTSHFVRLKYEVKHNGLQESESVAHPTWIPVAFWGEYTCFFMNVDPESEWYGSIKGMEVNEPGERHEASHLGEFLALILNYMEALEVTEEIEDLGGSGQVSWFPVKPDERDELDKELAELKKKKEEGKER